MNKKIKALIITAVCVALAVVLIASCFSKKENTQTGFAMGSAVTITAYGRKNNTEAAEKAIADLKRADSEFLSPTAEGSLVYRLNLEGEAEGTDDFIRYLKNCLILSKECAGFTLLSGAANKLWKIEDGGYIPTEEEINQLKIGMNDENLVIEGNKISLKNGGKLNFGAIGKGTACQYATELLKSKGEKDFLCNVGGTLGLSGSPKGSEKFSIGVRNPFGGVNEYFGTLKLTDCFVSTSGNYEKYFEKDGIRYCHIFDSRTGEPVQNNLASVTVIADNGDLCDFLSTAVYISGENEGIRLAEKFNAEVLIVRQDKTVIMSESLKPDFKLTDDSFTVL